MKESKFIELLNLYVDHHISPADAAELEAEVRSNPERRRVYGQYCRMQKACNQLGETFRQESPAPVVASKIVDFKPRRRALASVTFAAGIAAAAACVAVIYVVRSGSPVPAARPEASLAQALPPPPAVAATRVAAERPALQPAFGPRSLSLRSQETEMNEAAAVQVAFGDWMHDVRLSSMEGVRLDELRFDGSAPLRSVPSDRTVRPFQGKVEMTAFKFQR